MCQNVHLSSFFFVSLVEFCDSCQIHLICLVSDVTPPLGFVLSEKRVCTRHTKLHCRLPALARSTGNVLGAVVYVSCPQLVSQLVVFTCLSRPERCSNMSYTSSERAKKQSHRCCQKIFVAGIAKGEGGLTGFVVS